MADPFLGEIRMFAGTYAPEHWAFCDGQLIQMGENPELYSLLGTVYGGNGVTNFALPDLRGRIPIHFGTGPGLTRRDLGESSGAEAVAINTVGQLPSHSHTLQASGDDATGNAPQGKVLGVPTKPFYMANPSVDMHSSTIDSAGKSQGHYNMMPSLCVNFIIALKGYYPPRIAGWLRRLLSTLSVKAEIQHPQP